MCWCSSQGIILTCLPMLGAQIGIISGTLNLMTEKAKARPLFREKGHEARMM